jgi:hypothetical protein
MFSRDKPEIITLPVGQLWARRLPRNARILCQQGTVLLTLEGVLEEFELRPGQAAHVPRAGKAVVEGFEGAVFRVDGVCR